MKNNYFVIHSTDKWLLARLATDLMMEGIENDERWNDIHHPFVEEHKWMAIFPHREFAFHPHTCGSISTPTRFTITKQNYLDVLNEIFS